MALLDRFRTQSRHKHPDPAVRLAFVQEIPLDERELLAEIAREDADRARAPRGGREADGSGGARRRWRTTTPTSRCARRRSAMLRDIALEAFEGVGEAESLAAVDALEPTRRRSSAIAKNASRESTAQRALARVTDVHALGSIARHAEHESVRRAAFDGCRITPRSSASR